MVMTAATPGDNAQRVRKHQNHDRPAARACANRQNHAQTGFPVALRQVCTYAVMAAATVFIVLMKRLDGGDRHPARAQALQRLINDKSTECANKHCAYLLHIPAAGTDIP
jgi:hypothetical protein